jgi:signal transduction histidine kinase/DNA-binding NarL/FixJ family response regulator/HPt (histidine-containing phosphotransfer) domain-containing protein
LGDELEQQLALSKARAVRQTIARAEAERLLELKSRELYESNKKLALAHSRLENDVKHATYKLSVSNKLLQAALNERSSFIGQMSHEVRTPLNAIIGLSEILYRTKLDEAQLDYIETINSGAKSLIVLLNDMLDITKIEAGRVEINPRPARTHQMHQNIIAMFATEAKSRGLTLDLAMSDSVPRAVRIDKGRYKQIINNLITNALKNTKQGGILVDVGYQANTISKGMGLLTVKVVDTGVGIARSQLSNIFNAYEQIGRPDQGVGLGLAICQQLSELMMGKIFCESKVGRGSIFKLSLPVEQLDDSKFNAVNKITPILTPVAPLRILVAEDNPINQKVITAQLAQLGQRADVVNNGAEAMSALIEKEYDVIILDILMPVMDGEETIVKIRAAKSSIAQNYCIALTASTYEDQRTRLLDLGFDVFLSKPLALSELSTALNDVPRGLWVTMSTDGSPSFTNHSLVDDVTSQNSFDYTYLKTQFGDAYKSIFKQIAPTFLEYAYADLALLQEAVAADKTDHIEKVSHSMKGAASSIGLSALANMLLKIENASDDPAVQQWVKEVESMMLHLRPLIERELNE